MKSNRQLPRFGRSIPTGLDFANILIHNYHNYLYDIIIDVIELLDIIVFIYPNAQS